MSNREITGRLLELCGADWERVRQVPDRKAHDERYSLDTRKAAEQLGFTAQITLADGLAETVAWYRDNRSWWEPLRRKAQSAPVG